MVTAPHGRPIWVSPVRPGREHAVLGDLGEQQSITVAVKASTAAGLPEATEAADRAHNGLRARAETGNARLKMRYAALRRVSVRPGRIGAITAGAEHEEHR